MKKLIFLGGTVSGNKWRRPFSLKLIEGGIPAKSIFDPVVSDWNEEAQKAEEDAKKNASHLLFYLGTPGNNQLSAYSMVEATMALYDRPKQTVVVFDASGLDEGHTLKAFKQAEKVLRTRFPKAHIFSTLDDAADWLIKGFK